MCTVLMRFDPAARWPLLLGAVRDEFLDRGWDPPARHWAGAASRLVGGRDRVGGGTWLVVDPAGLAVAALLNGIPLASADHRPTRGQLPLAALTGTVPPPAAVAGYDRFHLLLATPDRARLWTWDGSALAHLDLPPGDHVLGNVGVDRSDDPLVPHFLPLLAATPSPDPRPGCPTHEAWGDWVKLLAGDGLDPADRRALIVRRQIGGRWYGSTSSAFVALAPGIARYDFATRPGPDAEWSEVPLGGPHRP